MSYRSILVHLDAAAATDRRVAVAGRLAKQFDAHLAGLVVVAPLELPQRLRSHPGAKAMLKQEFEKSLAAAKAVAKAFPARARAAGAPSAEARVAEAEPLAAIGAAARSADLLVLGQPVEDDLGALGSHFAERAILQAGRPALLVPARGAVGTVGENVLVAWKDAAASARALADAVPVLAKARTVTVLVVEEDGARSDVAEAFAYLGRRGVKARAAAVKSADAGAAILAQAKKTGADLVVMGAFARPRFAEMVLGGATRTVLQNMRSCVLMSH